MARYAIHKNGIVVNIVEAEETFATAQGWIPALNAGIGWLWDGINFTAPPTPVITAPASCSRRQGRLALLQNNLLDKVEAAIAAIVDPTAKRQAEIEYEADTWERKNAFLQQMWAQLGGTSAGLDDLFRVAVTL